MLSWFQKKLLEFFEQQKTLLTQCGNNFLKSYDHEQLKFTWKIIELMKSYCEAKLSRFFLFLKCEV